MMDMTSFASSLAIFAAFMPAAVAEQPVDYRNDPKTAISGYADLLRDKKFDAFFDESSNDNDLATVAAQSQARAAALKRLRGETGQAVLEVLTAAARTEPVIEDLGHRVRATFVVKLKDGEKGRLHLRHEHGLWKLAM